MSDNYDISPFGCVGNSTICPVEASIYGYAPNQGANIFFLCIFAICGIINVVLGIRYKTWTYMIALGLACFTLALGCIGRIIMSKDPFSIAGFQIQICCLTLAPAFNAAAIYLILKHVVRVFGREQSRIKPKFYTWIFICADICALVLQGIGGGLASTADDDDKQLAKGDKLMLSGVSFQVVTLVLFAMAGSDYAVRRYRALPIQPLSAKAQEVKNNIKFKIFVPAYFLAYATVLARCIYRIVEMQSGWGSSLMKNENLFIIMESVMLSIATLCQTVPHPGFCFPAISKTSMRMHKEIRSSDDNLTPPNHETIQELKASQV